MATLRQKMSNLENEATINLDDSLIIPSGGSLEEKLNITLDDRYFHGVKSLKKINVIG